MFCQLEILQNCFPQNVRRVLQELPASLDETYERILSEILKANPDQAFLLLQCLTVATRPLGVDELAEIIALDFNGGKDGIPELNADWRWGDKQQGVLATCSSLIVVVKDYAWDDEGYSETHVVQFAHYSVKEFLTSDRLADIKANISRFQIQLEPAHTIIAQSCLAILLQSDHDNGAKTTSPLYKYAAQHWVGHARFGNVLSRVEYGMRRLFDPAKPYLAAWLKSYDPDTEWSSFLKGDSMFRRRYKFLSISLGENNASLGENNASLCLYYAAVCGFRDLTRYLIVNNPHHVNATVGKNKSPLAAALYNRHFEVAKLLHQHGAVLPIGHNSRTLLHAASADGMVDVAEWLLNIDADASARVPYSHRTPPHFAAANEHLDIVQMSLGHGVDVDATAGTDHDAPLDGASSSGQADIMRPLIEHGVDVDTRDQDQWTPLHLASSSEDAESVQLLIKHGADVDARDESHSTPLHLASSSGKAETVQLLIKHGADVHARDQSHSTPLHLASSRGDAETVQLLIKHGADVHVRNQSQSTPLHLASTRGYAEKVQLLIKHGADVRARD